jgi:hypothetical protein
MINYVHLVKDKFTLDDPKLTLSARIKDFGSSQHINYYNLLISLQFSCPVIFELHVVTL